MDSDFFGSRSADFSTCRTGVRAYLPENLEPLACKDINEVYACGFSETRCDGNLWCGTEGEFCDWR